LNARLNDEFKKFYSSINKVPIVRDVKRQRYLAQEGLLRIVVRNKEGWNIAYNIAPVIIEIIDAYAHAKRAAFQKFIRVCHNIERLEQQKQKRVIEFK